MADPTVKEMPRVSVPDTERSEHSLPSRSKKVIPGPMSIPIDEVTAANKKPVVGAVGGAAAQITLEKGKAYRLAATTDTYIRMVQGGAAAADATDVILFANQYVQVECTYWNILNFVQVASAGIIQAIEVE